MNLLKSFKCYYSFSLFRNFKFFFFLLVYNVLIKDCANFCRVSVALSSNVCCHKLESYKIWSSLVILLKSCCVDENKPQPVKAEYVL